MELEFRNANRNTNRKEIIPFIECRHGNLAAALESRCNVYRRVCYEKEM